MAKNECGDEVPAEVEAAALSLKCTKDPKYVSRDGV
jgi:hypothetical protein